MARIFGIRLQSGALPYRVAADGSVRVLLVESRRRKRWTIPKGTAVPHLTLAENAAKEAFEEAGVIGEVAPKAAGMYRAIKQRPLGDRVVEVWVFLMRVTDRADDWPERKRRRAKWFTPDSAVAVLRQPLLRDLCRQLAQRRPAVGVA